MYLSRFFSVFSQLSHAAAVYVLSEFYFLNVDAYRFKNNKSRYIFKRTFLHDNDRYESLLFFRLYLRVTPLNPVFHQCEVSNHFKQSKYVRLIALCFTIILDTIY